MKKIFNYITLLVFIFLMSFSTFSFSLSNMKKEEKKVENVETEEKVDYDLTNLSETVLLSQLKNIQNNSKKYIGKTIKYKGVMYSTSANGTSYYIALCNDAAACCSAGFEFVLKSGKRKASDYPKDKEKILVSGRLEEYIEDGRTYLNLVDAEVKTLK